MAATQSSKSRWSRRSSRGLQVPVSGERIERGEIDTLLVLSTDPNPYVRGGAVKRLCPCHIQANDARVWDRLIAMADDPDVYVRAQILHALADGSPHEREAEVVEAIEGMWHDPD